MSWAKLLNRVFKIDITEYQFCRGEVKIIAAMDDEGAVESCNTGALLRIMRKLLKRVWDADEDLHKVPHRRALLASIVRPITRHRR